MAGLTSTPLSDFSKNWTFLTQEMQALEAKGSFGSKEDAREQVEVPGGTFDFQVKGGNSIAMKCFDQTSNLNHLFITNMKLISKYY